MTEHVCLRMALEQKTRLSTVFSGGLHSVSGFTSKKKKKKTVINNSVRFANKINQYCCPDVLPR